MSLKNLIFENALSNLSLVNSIALYVTPTNDAFYKRLVSKIKGDKIEKNDWMTKQMLLDDTQPAPSREEIMKISESGKWLSRLNFLTHQGEKGFLSDDRRYFEIDDVRCSIIANTIRHVITVSVVSTASDEKIVKLCLQEPLVRFSQSNVKIQTTALISSSARDLLTLIHPSLRHFLSLYPQYSIVFTGHSKGGAIARVMNMLLMYPSSTVVTFGCPAVFNKKFCESEVSGYHFCLSKDLIPRLTTRNINPLSNYVERYVSSTVAVLSQNRTIHLVPGNSNTMTTPILDEDTIFTSSATNSLISYAKFFNK